MKLLRVGLNGKEKPAVGGLQASRALHLADLIEKAVSMPSEDILLKKGI